MHDAGHGPETTGRHRQPQAVSSPPSAPISRHRTQEPEAPVERPRRRHALPKNSGAGRPKKQRRHGVQACSATPKGPSRLLRRTLVTLALAAMAVGPVLARSTSTLGLHDAVAAEIAANPGQADGTLEALRRGGILAGSVTPPNAPAAASSAESPFRGTRTGSTSAPGATSPGDASPGTTTSAAVPAVAGTTVTVPPTGGATAGSITAGSPSTTGSFTTESTGSTPSIPSTGPGPAAPTRSSPTEASPTVAAVTEPSATEPSPSSSEDPGNGSGAGDESGAPRTTAPASPDCAILQGVCAILSP